MSEAPYHLHASLGYSLSIASRQQERRLDEQLKALGLTRITWCIILAVGNEGLTQPSDIATFVGIDRTATSRALRQMEAAKLLDRQSGTEDRRTRQVTLTRKGRKALETGTPIARGNNAKLAETLTAEEAALLKDLLDRMIASDDKDLTYI
ncbi:MarR family transcriptional regulator [Pseudooceanicola sp. 216_PA32_1]|uniref:MarR family transcriptional regulator n=1 Tax=Pseudooceanicola pacificus TaxID=2676438 RepID=A0A844WCX9_9RHOB|nr:MarR family transcriptional regulator [Pseudooceanicola pacificus]MWB78938.1 MarR family transcriptional regulator [Pseudooceanicola pacificus]